MIIRKVTETDAPAIKDIYNYYIENTTITFEIAPVSLEEIKKRIRDKVARFDWMVGEVDQKIIGYSYYGTFRERAAYNNTVESTIILDHRNTGKGYGTEIYRQLIKSAQEHGFKEMIAVIALPNPESIHLHLKQGFREAGVLKNVGFKFNKYLDTGLWQKALS
jgi:L-amino acid N-acyltransferase YncA